MSEEKRFKAADRDWCSLIKPSILSSHELVSRLGGRRKNLYQDFNRFKIGVIFIS